jgi:hypothetical protein
MPKIKQSFDRLQAYLPEGSFDRVMHYIVFHRIHLTITQERSSVLGDYRGHIGKNHRISVNGNLNKFAFLYTLIHEFAHLLVFEKYGNRVAPHGVEWKMAFSGLLREFLTDGIFPEDVKVAIDASLNNPAASSCAEEGLMRVFRKYDTGKNGYFFVEELEQGDCFSLKDGRVFRREEKLRKRYRCTELSTGRVYLFSPIVDVLKLPEP